MEYRIEKWEELDLLVFSKVFNTKTSDEEIPKFWGEYYENEECKNIPSYLGVCQKIDGKTEEFKYGIGCLKKDRENIPSEFEVIHVPEYEWAVFKCVGPSPKSIQDMWDKINKKWPLEDYEKIADLDIENYLPGDPDESDYVSEICIPVKKKRQLVIKGIYRHFKGDLYLVEDIIYHCETKEKMVAYRALYGERNLWCRPYDNFLEEVNRNGQKYRFELVDIKSVREKEN